MFTFPPLNIAINKTRKIPLHVRIYQFVQTDANDKNLSV